MMAQRQAIVNIEDGSKSTMTTIGQPSHIVNRVERAFEIISKRENIIPIKKEEKKEYVKALKEKKNLETDDVVLLGVIAFLVNEGFQDKTFLSTLFWIFMGQK